MLEVDHIVRIKSGGAAWDMRNLQALCRSCHIAKTARENGRRPTPGAAAWKALVEELT